MRLLEKLATLKGHFGRDAARETIALLTRLATTRLRNPADLIHFHETVLYLRAYPPSPRVLRLSDQILRSFSSRLHNIPLDLFENPEISGIAGTSLATNFSHDVVKRLISRHPKSISIDWDAYDRADRLGYVLSELIPESREDFGILSHPDARRWFTKLREGFKTLVEKLDSRTYDLLEIPLLWHIGDSTAARSHTRLPHGIPRREIFYHDRFLKRSEISLAAEFASPKIPVTTLTRPKAEKILATILDTSAVRYRELYGFTYPDRSRVRHTDLGRGMDFFFFGVDPKRKLIRDYHAGMYFKNGVPIGYVELLSEDGVMEVGFNLYYTFRESETAWLYARLLKIFHERLGAHRFTIDPSSATKTKKRSIPGPSGFIASSASARPRARSPKSLRTKNRRSRPIPLIALARQPFARSRSPHSSTTSQRLLKRRGAFEGEL